MSPYQLKALRCHPDYCVREPVTAAISTFVAAVTVESVVTGAVIGAVTSAVTGGNILKGALLGGLGGALTSGLGGVMNAASGAASLAEATATNVAAAEAAAATGPATIEAAAAASSPAAQVAGNSVANVPTQMTAGLGAQMPAAPGVESLAGGATGMNPSASTGLLNPEGFKSTSAFDWNNLNKPTTGLNSAAANATGLTATPPPTEGGGWKDFFSGDKGKMAALQIGGGLIRGFGGQQNGQQSGTQAQVDFYRQNMMPGTTTPRTFYSGGR